MSTKEMIKKFFAPQLIMVLVAVATYLIAVACGADQETAAFFAFAVVAVAEHDKITKKQKRLVIAGYLIEFGVVFSLFHFVLLAT